mmetsp:Transcript_22896/g.53039  ORF Transcript_22896/g.53039 Transcript_22896/m.53039 type:complete len:327 (-) Transcript_22896:46-1026(-)
MLPQSPDLEPSSQSGSEIASYVFIRVSTFQALQGTLVVVQVESQVLLWKLQKRLRPRSIAQDLCKLFACFRGWRGRFAGFDHLIQEGLVQGPTAHASCSRWVQSRQRLAGCGVGGAADEIGASTACLMRLGGQHFLPFCRIQRKQARLLARFHHGLPEIRSRNDEDPTVPLMFPALGDLILLFWEASWPTVHHHNIGLVAYEVHAHFASPLVCQGPNFRSVLEPEVHVVHGGLTAIFTSRVWTGSWAPVPPPAPLLHLLMGNLVLIEEAVYAIVVSVAPARDRHHALAELIDTSIYAREITRGVDVARLGHQREGLLAREHSLKRP